MNAIVYYGRKDLRYERFPEPSPAARSYSAGGFGRQFCFMGYVGAYCA